MSINCITFAGTWNIKLKSMFGNYVKNNSLLISHRSIEYYHHRSLWQLSCRLILFMSTRKIFTKNLLSETFPSLSRRDGGQVRRLTDGSNPFYHFYSFLIIIIILWPVITLTNEQTDRGVKAFRQCSTKYSNIVTVSENIELIWSVLTIIKTEADINMIDHNLRQHYR